MLDALLRVRRLREEGLRRALGRLQNECAEQQAALRQTALERYAVLQRWRELAGEQGQRSVSVLHLHQQALARCFRQALALRQRREELECALSALEARLGECEEALRRSLRAQEKLRIVIAQDGLEARKRRRR